LRRLKLAFSPEIVALGRKISSRSAPMKRIPWLTILVLAASQVGGSLVHGAPAPAGPQARYSELLIDFGKVTAAEIKRHTFVVTNTGSATLVVSDVAPGCGCTTAGAWDKEIAPGKTGRIPIEFNPANFSGVVAKSVVVTTNDPDRPMQVLDIRANVWRPLEIEPAFTSFLPIEGEARTETKVVRILNNLEKPVTLESPQSTNPHFKTELKSIQPGKEFELHISYDSAVTPPSLNTAISIKTSVVEQPVLNITAFAMPQPAVVTIPAAIQLPPVPITANYTYNVVVRNNATAALQVTSASASLAGLGVKIIESQAGRIYYVSVSFPKDFKVPAENPPVITIKTSHPRFAEIRVPVLPPVAPAGATANAAK
jgi:hypothetical protein